MRAAPIVLFTLGLCVAVVPTASCTTKKDEPSLRGDALYDASNCTPCHADHVRQWSGSMHAYAAEDPVFLAMNRRMQRETNGAAGDFCVKCHAPLAVKLGKTKDGLNLAELPASIKGVTCYFCHAAHAVNGTSNNAVAIADDGVMRGPIGDPASSMPHAGAYSRLHDREAPESASLCGGCHDVVTPRGAHIERTFLEWKESLYAKAGQLTCGKCHMDGRDGLAADAPRVGLRRVHDHAMPGVDVALTPFAEAADQRERVQQLLDGTLITKLCVKPSPRGVAADVVLDNAFAGHKFPSGANQDRRAWVELVAYRAGTVVFSSGVVPEKKAVVSIGDPNLWVLRDKVFGADGKEVHMFWEAARVEAEQLPPAVTNVPTDPAFYHAVTRTYELGGVQPDRITLRVKVRPVDFDLLDELVTSKDLDPALLDRVPTFVLGGASKEWTPDKGFQCVN
jgi:hypothetical protein